MGDRLKAGWIKKQSPKQELWFKWFIIDYSFAAITSNSENLNFGGQGGSMSRQFIKHSMKFHRIPFHTSDHKRSHESKIFAKRFSSWGIDRNITKTSCHSRLFLVLHLLVNTVIIMAIARKGVERVFILIQFFSCLIKWGLLFRLGVLKRNHPCVRLNGLFDFCIPWNCQKIIDFLMVLI